MAFCDRHTDRYRQKDRIHTHVKTYPGHNGHIPHCSMIVTIKNVQADENWCKNDGNLCTCKGCNVKDYCVTYL